MIGTLRNNFEVWDLSARHGRRWMFGDLVKGNGQTRTRVNELIKLYVLAGK